MPHETDRYEQSAVTRAELRDRLYKDRRRAWAERRQPGIEGEVAPLTSKGFGTAVFSTLGGAVTVAIAGFAFTEEPVAWVGLSVGLAGLLLTLIDRYREFVREAVRERADALIAHVMNEGRRHGGETTLSNPDAPFYHGVQLESDLDELAASELHRRWLDGQSSIQVTLHDRHAPEKWCDVAIPRELLR